MDFSSPLATVTPTLDAGVLQTLASTTRPCTAAEVHRRLGRGSDEGVRKVLARLVEQGVVLVDVPARYPLYVLNREHVAAAHIEGLTRLRAALIERIRDEVAAWPVKAAHSAVFGSFARGTADVHSDIDILLVRRDDLTESQEETWLAQLDALAVRVRAWTGNVAQLIDTSPTALSHMVANDDPLLESWRNDAIHLTGVRLAPLLRRTR